nr:8-amino-7-oxononanoate synthase [Phytohalomonas tamaricis]
MEEKLRARLDGRHARQRYRQRRLLQTPQAPCCRIDGRDVLAFCSNDYLGLAADPRLAEALAEGARRFGVGGGASHVVNGHSEAHERLEHALAELTGRSRALLFSSGYQANLGAIGALVERGDRVLHDRLNHASLLDGAQLAGARFARYRHGDAAHLATLLTNSSDDKTTLVVSDGVFSMDGDIAPLAALSDACRCHQADLMIDDAHGLGVLGDHGGGSLEQAGLDQNDVPVLVGTLGKALGTQGAFVAGSDTLIEGLIQFARPYVYTTSLSPALAWATLVSLEIVRQEPGRRHHLHDLIAYFRRGAHHLGLPLMTSPTPIQPLLIGHDAAMLTLARALEGDGILVGAIRPPTVPEGSARLRISLSSAHTYADIDRLLDVLVMHWHRLMTNGEIYPHSLSSTDQEIS